MDGRARHSPHADPPRNGTGLGLARAQVGIHPHSPPPIAMKIILSSSSSLHLFFIAGEEQEEEEKEEEEAEVGFKTVRKEERRKNAAALASGSRSAGRSRLKSGYYGHPASLAVDGFVHLHLLLGTCMMYLHLPKNSTRE